MHDVITRFGRKGLLLASDAYILSPMLAYALADAYKAHFGRGIYNARLHAKRRCKHSSVVVAVLAVRGKHVVFAQTVDYRLCSLLARTRHNNLCTVERERLDVLHDGLRIEIILGYGLGFGFDYIFGIEKLIVERKR